ncbi:MAG: winged helix-turn-helix domain-containing protein [Acidobacteriaceae bacterium]
MPETGSIYEFLGFRLDCGRFELLRNGQPLRVERKPMELLILLVSRERQLVTRVEIVERLWSSDVFVDTEHGINTAIRKLRYSLRDSPDSPRFIETVTGRGYRFIAPVSVISEVAPDPAVAPASVLKWKALGWYIGAAACLGLAFGGIALYRSRQHPPEVQYTKLTDFTDSAVAPALSPDGRLVAFIRGGEAFLSPDQIYVKMLPDGEARRVTDDDRPKYALTFSPDSTEIAYTVLEGSRFSTYEVSTLGGEPHLLLQNAAGLVWLDRERVLYSRVRPGEAIHLGVVTSALTGAGLREVYFPQHERGMAHKSYPSPDRRWALVVEMNGNGDWAPCRLVALDGQGPSRIVGPTGACTSAGWSPDGRRMYFTAAVNGQSHIWRQRYPDGKPEQITFGPTEEDGIAVEPHGRAVITSVGVHESAIWMHDGNGERPLSSEGEIAWWLSPPVFSPDGAIIYYLLRSGDGSGTVLWRTVVSSDASEPVFPGIDMTAFDLSPDGKQVVYTTAAPGGTTQLWQAALDRSSPATKLAVPDVRSPHFGVNGQILFTHAEGNLNYLERVDRDGTHRSKVFPYPILEFQGVSPSRRWIVASAPRSSEGNHAEIMAIPLDGGPPLRICADYCKPKWSTDGDFLFVSVEEPSRSGPGRSLAIPLGPGESFPRLPAEGIAPLAEASVVHGAESVGRAEVIPGKDPAHYAWVNTTVHRNLYKISLP